MPPESPRKSSTSSGNRFDRPRYLLVEVSGVPSLSSPTLSDLLRRRLAGPSGVPEFRIVRVQSPYGIVAVPHRGAPTARASWNDAAPMGPVTLRTRRTFGTLRKAKRWLAGPGRRPPGPLRPAKAPG